MSNWRKVEYEDIDGLRRSYGAPTLYYTWAWERGRDRYLACAGCGAQGGTLMRLFPKRDGKREFTLYVHPHCRHMLLMRLSQARMKREAEREAILAESRSPALAEGGDDE